MEFDFTDEQIQRLKKLKAIGLERGWDRPTMILAFRKAIGKFEAEDAADELYQSDPDLARSLASAEPTRSAFKPFKERFGKFDQKQRKYIVDRLRSHFTEPEKPEFATFEDIPMEERKPMPSQLRGQLREKMFEDPEYVANLRRLEEARGTEKALERGYTATKGSGSGFTGGLYEYVFRAGERKFLGEEFQPTDTTGMLLQGAGELVGGALSGQAIAGVIGKAKWLNNIKNVAKHRLALRGLTAATHGGLRAFNAWMQGKRTGKEALADVAAGVGGALIGIFPETWVKAGVGNMVSQVAVDAVYDHIVDLGLRSRLDDQSYMQWLLTEELPSLAMSTAFALRDYADENFRDEQDAIKRGFAEMIPNKIREHIDNKFKADLSTEFEDDGGGDRKVMPEPVDEEYLNSKISELATKPDRTEKDKIALDKLVALRNAVRGVPMETAPRPEPTPEEIAASEYRVAPEEEEVRPYDTEVAGEEQVEGVEPEREEAGRVFEPRAGVEEAPADRVLQTPEVSDLTPEQESQLRLLREQYKKDIALAELDWKYRPETLAKRKKALGMQYAADKRRILNKLTPKERKAQQEYEAKIRQGDKVIYRDTDGTGEEFEVEVLRPAVFGKVKVRFPDGTEKNVQHAALSKERPVKAPEEASRAPDKRSVDYHGRKVLSLVKEAISKGKPISREVLEKYKGEKWADDALAKMDGKQQETIKATEDIVKQLETPIKREIKPISDETVSKADLDAVSARIAQESQIKPFEEVAPVVKSHPEIKNKMERELADLDATETEAKIAAEDSEKIGLTHEEALRVAAEEGYELPEKEKEGWLMAVERMKQEGQISRALANAEEVFENPNRILSNAEQAGFIFKKNELRKARKSVLFDQHDISKRIREATEAKDRSTVRALNNEVKRLVKQEAEINRDLKLLEQAAYMSGSRGGRSQQFRQAMLDSEKYTLEHIKRRARANKGDDLTKAEEDELQKMWEEREKFINEAENEELVELEREAERKMELVWSLGDEDGTPTRAARLREIDKENEAIKNELRRSFADGAKDYSESLLTARQATLVGKLARNYAEASETAKNKPPRLKEIIRKIQDDFPEITTREAVDAVAAEEIEVDVSKKPRKGAKEAIRRKQKELREAAEKRRYVLEEQTDLVKEIDKILDDAALNGLDRAKRKELAWKLDKLADLMFEETGGEFHPDDQKLYDALKAISSLKDQMIRGYRKIKKPRNKREFDKLLKKAKEQLRLSQREMRANDKLLDLLAQLKTGKIKEKVKREPPVMTDRLKELRAKTHEAEQAIEEKLWDKLPLKKKLKGELWELSRTFMLTGDISYTFRQGARLGISHPITGAKAFYKASRSALDALAHGKGGLEAGKIMAEMTTSNSGKMFEKYGGVWQEFGGGEAGALFRGHWAYRMPVIGRLIAASDRHFSVGINALKLGAFESFVKNNPNATDKEISAYVDSLNAATGDVRLKGAWGQVIGGTSKAMIAPKFAISRFADPWMLFKPGVPPLVRKQLAKEWGVYLGSALSVEMLGELTGMWEVDKNPYSPDFLKVRRGDAVYDMFGAGYLQPARTLLRIALAQSGLAEEAGIDKKTWKNEISDFFIYKLHPSLGATMELIYGQNMWGQKTTIMDTVLSHITPLWAQAGVQFWTNPNIPVEDKLAGPLVEFIGGASNIYTKRGVKKTEFEREIERMEKEYDFDNYEKELEKEYKSFDI